MPKRILSDRPLTRAECTQRYRDRHPERAKASRKQYVAAHPEKIKTIRNAAHHRDPIRKLVNLARARAKKSGLQFDLNKDLITIPCCCPVLGIKLLVGGGTGFQDASPTIDRIDNNKGYTMDNIVIVSWRANRIKCDATVGELRQVAAFYDAIWREKWRA